MVQFGDKATRGLGWNNAAAAAELVEAIAADSNDGALSGAEIAARELYIDYLLVTDDERRAQEEARRIPSVPHGILGDCIDAVEADAFGVHLPSGAIRAYGGDAYHNEPGNGSRHTFPTA